MASGSRGWSRFGSLAVARAALGVLALALIAVACTQASAQTPTPTPTLAVSIDASGTDLDSFEDVATLTAVVANAPENGSPTYKWETRSNTNSTWMVVHPGYPHNDPELTWLEASAATIERDFRVTVSYGTEATATSKVVTVTWTAPASVPTAVPCTVTTTVAKPTGLTATVNPESSNADGILLEWNAPAASDEVSGYYVYRREVLQGTTTTLALHGIISDLPVYDTRTGEYRSSPGPAEEMDFADSPPGNLKSGTTYAYAIVAERTNNCDYLQQSEQSDEATATYTASASGDSGGDDPGGL